MLEDAHDPRRCTRSQPGSTQNQQAKVVRVKSVNILGRVDSLDDGLRVEPARKGKLDQDPVHSIVGVETVDLGRQSRLRNVIWQLAVKGANPHFGGVFSLAPDI